MPNRSTRRRLIALAAGGLLLAAACGSSSKTTAPPSTSATSATSTTSASSATTAAAPSGPIPGLTSSTLTVGTVSTLTGPVPGLFQGTVYGVDAYFNFINSQGGVNGRKLLQKSGDDALNCNQNASEVSSLTPQVFAFVGNESVVDSCAKYPTTTPVVFSEALTPQTQNLTNGYSPLPLPPGFLTGPFLQIKQKYPQDISSVGTLYASTAAFPAHAQQYAMTQAGWKITYQRGFGQTESNFTADILRMKAQGVKMLWLVNDTLQDGPIIQEVHQQGWHPLIVLYNGYDHKLIQLAGADSAQGVINFEQQAMYLGEDKGIPGVTQFMTWMGKTHPSFTPDLFSVYGWEAAGLFVQALKSAGANPTQASVLTALSNIHHFDASGLSAPFDPGSKQPSQCWLETTVDKGAWKRVTPPSGFACVPGGYAHYSGT